MVGRLENFIQPRSTQGHSLSVIRPAPSAGKAAQLPITGTLCRTTPPDHFPPPASGDRRSATHHETGRRNDEKYDEEYIGDVRRRPCDPGQSQHTGNHRDNQKCHSPTQHISLLGDVILPTDILHARTGIVRP